MQLLERTPQPTREPATHEPKNAEALIREARRLRRRRWLIGTLGAAALMGVGTSLVMLALSSSSASVAIRGDAGAGVLPNGPVATLQIAGPMAVAPDGVLYVADDQTTNGRDDRVLVRLQDGRFRVIAGTGKRGFSGDGGPAARADLSDVRDLAFAPDGTLYIADGGRVRTVSRDGIIRTIAGDGRGARTIAEGTPARSAALGSDLSIALNATGQLYISVGSPWGSPPSQILRLTASGTLDPVRALVRSAAGGNRADRMAIGKQLTGFNQIAVDRNGNIDVAGGPGYYGVWQITPAGNAHLVTGSYLSQRAGGADPVLEPGPQGAVYAATGRGILRVVPSHLVTTAFNSPLKHSVHGRSLSPLDFAMSTTGTLYVDDRGSIGYQLTPGHLGPFRQHLVSISNGHSRLLWQEHSATRK